MSSPFEAPHRASNSSDVTQLPGMILLMVLSASLSLQLLSQVRFLLGGGWEMFFEGEQPVVGLSYALGAVLLLGLQAYAVLGANHLRTGDSFTHARRACVLAVLPCTPCFPLAIPVGVWGLVVLRREGVRSRFKRK